jgi:hypothetical protein
LKLKIGIREITGRINTNGSLLVNDVQGCCLENKIVEELTIEVCLVLLEYTAKKLHIIAELLLDNYCRVIAVGVKYLRNYRRRITHCLKTTSQ